eukprot:m51a1_g8861 hypothetical protein (2311) ;mRNA; r:557910-567410
MRSVRAPSTGAVAALLLACACARAAAAVSPACAGVTDIVIGQSVGFSQIEKGAADGLAAAIREAAQLTHLPLRYRPYNHTKEARPHRQAQPRTGPPEELMANLARLVEQDCAFAIASTTGTSATEPDLLGYLGRLGVPFVGTLSASRSLRNVTTNTALFDRRGVSGVRQVRLPFVVNVRASGVDELDAVLTAMARDWTTLPLVGLLSHSMHYDTWVREYVEDAIGSLTRGAASLNVSATLGTEEQTDAQLQKALADLFPPQRRGIRALIVCTTPNTTAQFVTALAGSGRAQGLALYFVSWVSPEDLDTRLSTATRAQLASSGAQMYFTQNMPFPRPERLWQAPALLQRFSRAGTRGSHAALEGYLTGWFIYEAAQKAVALNGLPLTRGDFLSAVFADVRAFNVLGVTLGPYGNGGLSGGASVQGSSDECNQGVHEVFLTRFNPLNGSLAQLPGLSVRFAGCSSPVWSQGGAVTLVGSFDDAFDGDDSAGRSGLLGAVNAHNSQGSDALLLRSMAGNTSAAAGELEASGVVAVAGAELSHWTAARAFAKAALISPMPGFLQLRRPFDKRIVNLFPSAYDEMVAAFEFLHTKNVTRIAVLYNDRSEYTQQCRTSVEHFADTSGFVLATTDEDATTFVRQHAREHDAFVVVGGAFDSGQVSGVGALRLFGSQVAVKPDTGGQSSLARLVSYSLSVSPPLVSFASTSALRTEFATWVSDATDEAAFQGFFVGKFLSQVVDEAKAGDITKVLTADTVLDAVYSRGVFTVGGVQLGPFKDRCSRKSECCGQGSDTVYVLKGNVVKTLEGEFIVGDCGTWYFNEEEAHGGDDTSLVLGLAIGLGGAGLICIAILILVIWRTRRSVEFFNIRKSELELGQRLGQGRCGAMYMADWHGTTVAVRVIDKKATPKEDQRLIKEEVLLLHKLHHPNLLMLMGYCETGNDILVVTEYMEGGTLADYIRKEKRYASVYSLVAMAFMDAKGTVKVTDFWYSSKRGALSSSGSGKSLKRAAWQPPEVIAGTFLTPATDVYAFGIVLWELVAPPDMTSSSSSASGTACQNPVSLSPSSSAPPSPGMSPGMASFSMGSGMEMHQMQMGPPEIPHNASPEVADLLERCWQTQPERRPSVFQILRNWPTTFATLGAFEIPQDLIQSVGSANAAGLFSQHSSNSANNNAGKAGDSSDDEMAASMASFMALKVDSVALQNVGKSQTELGAARGLQAAIDEVKQLTALPLRLVQYSYDSEAQLVNNTHTLVVHDCAFMIAASLSTIGTEAELLRLLVSYGLPIVGTLSASESHRQLSLLSDFERIDETTGAVHTMKLPLSINVRASGVEELNAVLSLLSGEWSALSSIGLVSHNTSFGNWAQRYADDALRAMTDNPWGLRSSIKFGLDENLTDMQMSQKIDDLFGSGKLETLIVATTPETTAHFVSRLLRSKYNIRGLVMCFVACASPEDLGLLLSFEDKALLVRNDVHLLFTQNMPFPIPRDPSRAMPLLRRFARSKVPPDQRSHMALEGYLVGCFIFEVAQQAVFRNGLPLTPQSFLSTVFTDVRTFNVLGMTLGPYGDGGMSGDLSMQSTADACNQGVHEMHVTKYSPLDEWQEPQDGATFKFAGCRAPEWSAGARMTVVGSFDDLSDGLDTEARIGLVAAANEHNSEGASSVLIRSRLGNTSDSAGELKASKAIATLLSDLIDPQLIDIYEAVATIAPVPGYFTLNRPLTTLHRNVINVFPTAYDEVAAAEQWLSSRGVRSVGVIRNDASPYTQQCIDGLLNSVDNSTRPSGLRYHVFSGDAAEIILCNESYFDAFLVLGGELNGDSVPYSTKVRLLNSQAKSQTIGWYSNSTAREMTFKMSVSPPLNSFASTSDLRTAYNSWIATEDVSDASFAGFFVGKFLSQAIEVARVNKPSGNLTASDLIDAIYHRSIFTVGGIQLGPFQDKCSSPTKRDCCNQGTGAVYIQGGASTNVETFNVGDCGRWYIPLDKEPAVVEHTYLILSLCIGLGGGAIVSIIELELGQCLGKGRFGAIYMADWHGTTVAVRVIEKKATPKEDQRLIKEEVLLLHQHHHPNLLMLMGYCETGSDILVVTEYMEGGTLAKFLRKEKRYASVYSLVALAFMDGKGTVKVSDFWFSNHRGALSSSGSGKSLKKAAWQPPEVIAGTFLTPATDVYAFGIKVSLSPSSSAPASPGMSPGMASFSVEMHQVQAGPPEMPHNVSPEVADLLERCWQTQPERRPSVFQILRNWPTTFAALGAFEVPQDLIPSAGSANAAGLFSLPSSNSANNKPGGSSEDEVAASMASFMALKVDSVALQHHKKGDRKQKEK